MRINSKFKKFIISVLSAACVSAAAFGVAGCMPKSVDKSEPADKAAVTNARKTPPTDGSLPTAYSAADNLAYIVGKFDSQTQYHTYTEGVTAAAIATQVTKNWKDYKNGVLVNSDITYSSMVKSGTQSCTVFGKDDEGKDVADTYFRTSETPAENTTSTSAVWKQDAPTYFSENAYNYTYGFLPSELFNYAVNSNTIISSEELKVESDGTYTLSFSLDPVGSTFYYQFGMKTRGGLSDYPEFKQIQLTVNFNADWQINTCDIHEVSKINKGIVVSSVSDFTTVYYYGDDHFDNEHFSYYDSYYKQFLGDSSLNQGGDLDEELVMDVTNVLSNGFANILNGGQQFELSANLGNNKYVGYIFVGLDLADIAGSINLKVSLGKTLSEQNFYVEYANGEMSAYYGDDFGVFANLAAVKLQAEQFGEIIDKITAAISVPSDGVQAESPSDSSAEEGGDPLTALMDSMVLTATNTQATLVLNTDDLLGLGIGVDAKIVFGINGNKINFRGAAISGLSIGGEELDVSLGLKTTTASIISRNPSQTPADLADYVADVYSLLSSDLIKVTANINGDADGVQISRLKGVNVQVNAYADLSGIAVGADASASYTYNGNTVSAKLKVIYEYNKSTGKYGNAYLSLTEFNGVAYDLNVRCDIDELVSAISALLNNAGGSSSFEMGNLVSVLNSALSANLSSLLTEMYANGDMIKIGVSVDTVLDMLGVNAGVKFGSCALAYQKGEGVHGGNLSASLPAIGFSMGVCGVDGSLEKPNDEDYLDLCDILNDIKSFIDVKTVAVALTFNGSDFSAANIPELANLTASATIYADLNSGLAAKVIADVAYGNLTASITADYVYDSATYGTVILSLTKLCGEDRNVKIYCRIDEVVEGVKTLLTAFGTTLSATESTASGTAIDINSVLAGLLTADINAIIPNLEAKANVLNLTVNVDEALNLLNVSLGNLSIGEVALTYNHVGENLLTLNAPNFGLTATVDPYNSNLEQATTDNAFNLKDVLDDVNSILEAKKLAVALTFNGAEFSAANVPELANLTASATAFVDFTTGLAAQVNAAVSYKVDENKFITADIKVYFNYNKETIGDLIVVLDSINGVATSAKVCCNISELSTAIQTLISYVTPKNDAVNSTEEVAAADPATSAAASVLEKLITADFNLLVKDISASSNVFNLTVNVDEILKLFDLNLGVSIGDATLEYKHAQAGETADIITANVANFGLSLAINPTNLSINLPSKDDCFDLTKLIDVVNGAINQINAIKDDGKLYFEIARDTDENTPATYLYLDGICVQVWGKGEISWAAGAERVALDLSMSISEIGTDVTTLKLVYDKNKAPLVKVALNGVGIEIYQEDIDGVKNGFIEVYNKLAGVFGLKPIATTTGSTSTGSTDTTNTTASSTNLGSPDRLLALIFNLLASDDWVNEINNFTASVNGKSVALGYLTDANRANVAISTEGGLSIAYDGAFGERFSLGGVITVGTAAQTPLAVSFASCNMASSKDGEMEFIRLAYNFLFESIHGISVENILGSNTYAVTFELNGANTEVADIKDVYVKAEIYVTNEASINYGKLAEGLLVLDVKGVAINLHVITEYDNFGKAQFYINLNRVGDILLPDLKLKASQDSLYETFKVLFNTITDTNIMDVISGLLPSGGTADNTAEEQQPATGESQPVEEGTLDKVASILEKLLNFNFSAAVNAYEIDGVQYADVNLDNLLGQLGLNVGALGNLSVTINHNDHSMTTRGVAMVTNSEGVKEAKEWISLSSAKTSKRSYNEFKREDYLNIEFLPYLIEDIVKFATDYNGNVYEKFTLSGTITANIVSTFKINIDVANLTISMADNDFYFSGVLHVNKMSALGIVTIPDSTVGITYQNGYLTLARGLNTSTPEYRIMTFDYFMDHMLVKSDSDCVLKWWLNISGWDMVMSIINKAAGDLNVESGLTRTENVYLYDQSKKGQTQLISMYDYVEALKVMVNGTEYASFGDMSGLENEFGIYDNYYGFSLNARKVTGDVLTKLYAAIIRNDNGISAIKASGAIDSYVTFAATLNYKEGAKQEYAIGNSVQSGLVAPSMYTAANAIIDAMGVTVDYDHFVKNDAAGFDEKFGCFNLYYNSKTSSYDASYGYSNILYQHTLTIVNLDGTTQTRQVRQGSTIYLYDNASPLYTDESKQFRQLYTTQEGVIGETSVIMNTDLTVYALRVKAVDVILTSGSMQYTVNSFIGDKVPTTVSGLETIGNVTYEDGTQVGENDYITEELLKGANTLNVYGTFVQSIVEVNGINYEFTYDNATATGSYTVVGKAASFNTTLYCGANGKTLVLENEIGGYPVTAIGAEALANVDGHALRSVVVPSNIVSVGEKAFLDNVGMEKAVFLAENVTMYGKAGSTKSMPFYGCSVLSTEDSVNGKNGNEITYLKVYYNNITSASGDDWRHFRYVSKVFSFNFYIGENGGATISGGWDYVTASAVVDLGGITGSSLTKEAAEDILSRYYPLVSDTTFTGSTEIENALAVDFAQFDMTKNGITYKCVFTPAYSTVNGFTHVTYSVSYTAATIITVYSGVEFTYYGKTVKANTSTLIPVPVTDNKISLAAPTATGYTFLGYAYDNNGVLTFGVGEDIVAAGNTLYIIWGHSKVGTAFSVVTNTAGSALYMPSGTGIDGKWYDNSWNEVTSISTSNTVVYTRSIFTLTVKLAYKAGNRSVLHVGNNTSSSSLLSGTSIDMNIYEGKASFVLNNKVLTVSDGVNITEIYANEINWLGKETTTKRNISSSITGEYNVTTSFSVTLSY